MSVIRVPAQCLVRMVRRRDVPGLVECVMAWEPFAPDACSFIGSLSIQTGASGDALTLVLEGTAQPHDFAQIRDERYGQTSAEAMCHAVLEQISSELTTRAWRAASAPDAATATIGQRFTMSAAPMLQTASARRASMG